MNPKSKKKREDRIRKKKILQREFLMKENKDKKVRDSLQYLTRQRKTPIVNPKDSILERNVKILEKAMSEHEALLQFREENKDKSEEMFEETKKQQEEYSKQLKENVDD